MHFLKLSSSIVFCLFGVGGGGIPKRTCLEKCPGWKGLYLCLQVVSDPALRAPRCRGWRAGPTLRLFHAWRFLCVQRRGQLLQPRKIPHNKRNNSEASPSITSRDIWQITLALGFCKCWSPLLTGSGFWAPRTAKFQQAQSSYVKGKKSIREKHFFWISSVSISSKGRRRVDCLEYTHRQWDQLPEICAPALQCPSGSRWGHPGRQRAWELWMTEKTQLRTQHFPSILLLKLQTFCFLHFGGIWNGTNFKRLYVIYVFIFSFMLKKTFCGEVYLWYSVQ